MNKMFPLKSFFSWKEKKKEKKNSRLSGIPGYLLSIGLCVVFPSVALASPIRAPVSLSCKFATSALFPQTPIFPTQPLHPAV